ncbi:hypothetical protein JCGZ_05654 [Jatropha curcas]|uniref:Uncharacterized protein n=2 Tax=Jatropha curcas TaxID=180498 RepID=A0A067L6Z2_JATCU|nr:hypothetical protein JCGZ_05654 [Jatropha curcas]
MEELGSLWSYESVDELRQKLLCTTIELEAFKGEANEEIRKHKEDKKHLIDLLKMAYKERDEAKDQLQKLINKLLPSNSTDINQIILQPQPGSPLVIPMKANSSITESNSLSDTYNAVTSPDLSSMNMADSGHIDFVNKAYVQEYNTFVSPIVPKIDPADAAIDSLVNGKNLPQKGKLLQAVTEAGPLLQNLIVAGPLPRWRNPPPLQTFRIPPVSIKGCEKAVANANSAAQKPLNSISYPDMCRGSSQMCSASVLNFATGGASSSGLDSGYGWPLNSAKRQRFH